MAKYVYDAAQKRMVDKNTGEPMVSGPWRPVAPRVSSDIEPYQSPVDGTMICSRSKEREHMRQHGVHHVADERKPKKLVNRRFIEKHGLWKYAGL